MPLTAVHAEAGVLDATREHLDDPQDPDSTTAVLTWDQIHRVRPRAPLSCRECGHGLHAKVSRTGMRFFAHDPGAPECGLVGESLAHRLLKVELATAIRTTGWHAELEVPGNGWRADVLATSPDGTTRMAWEAQLAATTADELAARTAAMAADDVAVCWVVDKDRPFLGHVPSIRINPDTDQQPDPDDPSIAEVTRRVAAPALEVVDGLGAFEPDWCTPRSECQIAAQHGKYGDDEGPCPGHGRWVRTRKRLELHDFVRYVLTGAVRLHRARRTDYSVLGRRDGASWLWTTRRHWQAEQDEIEAAAHAEQVVATARARRDANKRNGTERLARIVALELRQQALTPSAVAHVEERWGGYVGVRDKSAQWAMGVPLFVEGQPRAVICPVANRIDAEVAQRLYALTVVVATLEEQWRLANVCLPGQRIVRFEVDVQIPEIPTPPPGMRDGEYINLLLGRRSKYPPRRPRT